MAHLLIQGLCSVKYNTGDKSCGLSKVFCFEYGCTLHSKYKKQKLRAVFSLLMAKEGVTKTYAFFDRISDALQLWSQELHAVPNLQGPKTIPSHSQLSGMFWSKRRNKMVNAYIHPPSLPHWRQVKSWKKTKLKNRNMMRKKNTHCQACSRLHLVHQDRQQHDSDG